MPKRLRNPTQRKQPLRREALAREAISLRNQAKQAHDSETRVELEEMAERREILVRAFEAFEHENATPNAKPAERARDNDPPPEPSDQSPSNTPPETKG